MDPRGQALQRHATHMLQFRPGTDVALLNAIIHVIIEEELYDRQYVQAHTEGFERLRDASGGLPARGDGAGLRHRRPRPCARWPAPSPAPSARSIFWGMGISQHVHGTDNARCLIALAMMCGHVGRPGTGLHPLRGQNNVQGASDAGLIPMVFPDYQPRRRPESAAVLEASGARARPEAGPDRRRDHRRDPRGPDQGHVHHGREPRDVRPRRPARPRGAARSSSTWSSRRSS